MVTFREVLLFEDKFSRNNLLRCFADGLVVGEGPRTNAYERSDDGDIERLGHHACRNVQSGLVIKAGIEDSQSWLTADAGFCANEFGGCKRGKDEPIGVLRP